MKRYLKWTKRQRDMVNATYALVVGTIALYVILVELAPPLLEEGLTATEAVFIGGMAFGCVALARPDWAKQALAWAFRFKHPGVSDGGES